MFSGNWCAVETESRQPKDPAPPQLKAVICKEASTECEKRFGQILDAVVLAGSLARDEGTFVAKGQDRWSALGDAEFLLVFQRNSPAAGTMISVIRVPQLFIELTYSCVVQKIPGSDGWREVAL